MNYWQQRTFDAINALYDRDALLAEVQLNKEYQAVAKRIIRAMRLLYNDIKDGNITSVSSLYEYNRYYEIMNQLNEEMTRLGAKEITIIEPRLTNLYNEVSKVASDTFSMSGRLAKKAVDFVWCPDKLHWSDRVWKAGDQLKSKLLNDLVDCAVSGRKESELAAQLTQTFGASFGQASRLVRTEMSYIQNKAQVDQLTEAGFEYFEVLPAVDERTCTTCNKMTGLQFRLEDVSAGTNVPPFHPNCRCVVVGVPQSQQKMKSKYRAQGETPKGVDTEDNTYGQ